MELFERLPKKDTLRRPLPDRLRPTQLTDVLGQDHLLGTSGAIARMVQQQTPSSFVLWGPPGSGKTTIATLFANKCALQFMQVSATSSGVAELRHLYEVAESVQAVGKQAVLFVDEIHRFNRSQQDSFLPYVEKGIIILIGATTENPSFELNAALLSRLQVFVLNRLDQTALSSLARRAEDHYQKKLPLTQDAFEILLDLADGDGRYLLNSCETLLSTPEQKLLNSQELSQFLQRRAPIYDKHRENRHNLISALHKSLRASDVDAALYWLARMLTAGEDPLYITRRLIRFANEDIGLADPQAIHQALAARDVYQFLGSPEGELALAQAVLYLACAPKSNAVYRADIDARELACKNGSLLPPQHLLNATTAFMKSLGRGQDYIYDHDVQGSFSGQNCFPEGMARATLYTPAEQGFEGELRNRLARWAELRRTKAQQ